MQKKFEFGILGSTIVQMHGNPAVHPPIPPRQRQALAALLVQPNRRLSFAQLVDWIWGEDEQPPLDPKSTFHTYGHRIRRFLRTAGSRARLTTVNGGWRLDVDEGVIDYYVFRDLISRAHSCRLANEHERAAELAEAALGLWRDRPLADLGSRLARNWRRTLVSDEWLPANMLLLDQQIALSRFDAALRRLDELGRRHRVGLRFVKHRLQVLHALSRHSEATDVYLSSYQTLRGNGEDAEAEELRHFYDEVKRRFGTVNVAARADRPVSLIAVRPRLLPPDVVDFTGRADLLHTLDELTGIESGRLNGVVVMLSGIGGIGKTALAVRWARRAAARMSTGVLFVNLRGISRSPRMEAGDVVDTFLAALGFPVEHIVGPAGRAEKLRALLEEQPMPVVLDNAQSSAHVRSLLPLFGECAVVITSRHRLTELSVQHGIPSLTVRPLSPIHGVELLSGRIRSRAGEVPEALPALVELCEGLPLALTLVAERIASRPSVPLSAVAAQLRDRGTLLRIGNDGDGADGSLNAVFSLSYEALSVETGRLFRLLGLHPGTEVGVEVAAALLGERVSRVRQHLDELVGAQLVEQSGDIDRYRTHDLVLAHAAELAETDVEGPQATMRMLSFYLHSVLNAHLVAFPHIARPPVPAVVPGAEPMTFGDATEANAWYLCERININSILDLTQAKQTDYGWLITHLAARFMDRFGFYSDVVAGFSAAAELMAAQRNPQAASTFNDLGYFQLTLGDTEAAARNLDRALEILADVHSPTGQLSVRINLAAKERKQGNRAAAVRIYRDCLKMAREIADADREAKVEHYLGETFCEERQYDVATGHFERALELRQALSDTAGQIATLAELCHIRGIRGQDRIADDLAERARTLLDTARDVSAGIRLFIVLAELNVHRKRYAEVVEFAQLATDLARPTGNAEAEASALDLLGQGAAKLGEHEQARAAWLRAADIFGGRAQAWRAETLVRRTAELTVPPPIPDVRREDETASPAGLRLTEDHPDR